MKALTDRSEKLLALILLEQMKGASKQQKTAMLNLAGFSNIEIADILQTNSAQVARDLYESRKSPPKKVKPKKPATPG